MKNAYDISPTTRKGRNPSCRCLGFFVCFFILVHSGSAAAENILNKRYICRDLGGGDRWQTDVEVRNKQDDIYVMTEKGEGIYSSFNCRISWITEMQFKSTKDNVRPLRMEKRVFDEEGKMLRFEKQEFDFANNIVACVHEDFPRNIIRREKFRIKKDIVNRQLFALYIQKFIENGKTCEDIQMVSEEPNVYDIKINIVKKEDIEINGQKKEAYKLCIAPKLGLFGFIKFLFPETNVWHSASPGFEFFRYVGPEGGIKSAQVEITCDRTILKTQDAA